MIGRFTYMEEVQVADCSNLPLLFPLCLELFTVPEVLVVCHTDFNIKGKALQEVQHGVSLGLSLAESSSIGLVM